ncbi:Hypothetical_protein [Hexamita inflata]|uniref:Hypothetical_protein n=1 Tax=Hexamita inflata TaxID=28002 RepID=A0ABP1GLQ5_9EUKA
MTHLTVTLSSVLRLNLIIPSSSHKSWQSTNPNLVTQQRYLKLISISYLIFQDCHSKQPPQTTQVSSTLELTLLTSEVIFVTIFGMAGMNLGTSVSQYSNIYYNILIYVIELVLRRSKLRLSRIQLKNVDCICRLGGNNPLKLLTDSPLLTEFVLKF